MKNAIILVLLGSITGASNAANDEEKLKLVESLSLPDGTYSQARHDSQLKRIQIRTVDSAGSRIKEINASYLHNENIANVRFLGFAPLPGNATLIAVVAQWVHEDDFFKVWKFDTAGATVQVGLQATDNNVVLQGSMKEVMARSSQYLIKKEDATNDGQEVYFHINLAPGGVNDGSGMITGTLGTVVFKLLLAGKNGGYQLETNTLKNAQNSLVEVSLKLSMLKWAVEERKFAIGADYTLEEK